MFKQLKTKSKLKLLVLVILITAVIAGFYFWQKEPRVTRPPYIRGYRLVNEKISQSAPIVIHLPKKMDKKVAQNKVKFYPQLEGEWLTPQENQWGPKQIVFKPSKKLKLDRYYSVELTVTQSEPAKIKADFLAVEDPKIITIFPKQNSEAPEKSEVTIVFNRPMVPLTTLGHLEQQQVPVEIEPETKGRFKWITTRNLQFIPEQDLIRSSHYRIKVKPGLVSMDGLKVKGQQREFITRKLRYLRMDKGLTVYDQPLKIYFNQPVDLDKTKSELTLKNTTTGEEIPFVAQYPAQSGEVSQEKQDWTFGNFNVSKAAASLASQFGLGWPSRKEEKSSVIEIYPRADKFGRDKLWDFENNYSLTVDRAYPTEGDIILDKSRSTAIQVPSIIKDISAESERTKYASPDYFDPQGKLWVTFYEDINLDRSEIKIPELKDIGYGKRCKSGQEQLANCEQVPDRNKIYITFREDKVHKGQRLRIKFKRIVNSEGLTVNRDPLERTIEIYPKFKILRSVPAKNSTGASLTELILCSNSQILVPAREQFSQRIKANLPFHLNSWGNSWRVHRPSRYEECNPGEFHTTINYGLMPSSDYSFEFDLEDVFGQPTSYNLSFTSGEMPHRYLDFYHLQDHYNIARPSRTKLTYAAKNMEYVNLEICKLKPLEFLYAVEDKPSYKAPLAGQVSCSQVVRDKIELPDRYWIKNYFKVDIKDYFENGLGHYILTFSHPDYKKEYWQEQYQIYERTYLNVTNLSVAEKKIRQDLSYYNKSRALTSQQLSGLNNLYWVTDLSNLKPIPKAKVSLYKKTSSEPLRLSLADSYFTTRAGVALTEAIPNSVAVITKGNDSTVIPRTESRLGYARNALQSSKIYMYTDKPIYQPDQEVFIKGIYRTGYDGNYNIPQDPVTLKVYNSRRDEILSRELSLNDYGTFNTKVLLDKDAPLGMYRACVEEHNCTYFDVQEYVPAPFKVKAKPDQQQYVSKDTVNIEVNADYYFGVPLEGGEVSYTFSSQDYYFDRYSDGQFRFGERHYYPYYGERFLLRGKTSINEQGKATISEKLDFEKLFKNKRDRTSKIIVVNLTVNNPQGQSVSTQKSFIMHAGQFYLGLQAEKSFLAKNETTDLKVKSTDIEGNPVKVADADLKLYKLNWIHSKRLGTDGRYHYQWKKKRELVQHFEFSTDDQGNYSQVIKFSEEGSYEAEVSATDSRDNLVWSAHHFYVYGEKEVSVKPTAGTQLELEPEQKDLKVGQQGKVIIKSPYDEAKALIAIERGQLFDYQVKHIDSNLESFSFKVKPEYIPNVYVSVLLISPQPEVKFGRVEFDINTERKQLEVEVNSDKKHYLPGEEVTLDIVTKDYTGEPTPAELSISVVDLSVLALKGNPKKDPLVFFYGGFPLTVSTASNVKDILVEAEIPTKGGGGGGMAEAMAPGAEKELARKKRGVFKETAFWSAVVKTGQDGKARVKFTLPDNLTTWRTESLGLTKDTKLGVDYQQFVTRKKLMVTPLKPRFIIPGDTFYLGAKVFNQSKDRQRLDLSFDSPSLVLKDDPVKKFNVDSNQSHTVYFKVKAPGDVEQGEHKFTVSAKNSSLEDTVEQTINITPNNTYEVTATANYTTRPITKEYVFLPGQVVKDRGQLTVKSSATLAVFLSDALNSLLRFPYGCSEQIASKLDAIAAIKRGLDLPNLSQQFELEKVEYKGEKYTIPELVEVGLNEIYNNQQRDGGFSYWRHGHSSFYLTLHLVNTLQDLSRAGFEVNSTRLNKAADYLFEKLTSHRYLYQNKNTVILTSYTLFRLPGFDKRESLGKKIVEIAGDDLFIKEEASNTSLAYLALLLTNSDFDPKLKNKIFDVLNNRINIDARGAFLETNDNLIWQYYETSVKNTALYLKALVADQRDPAILDKTLRWLLNSRSKDGAWGSTNNTVSVIDAFTDFLKWKRETESNFTFQLKANDQTEGSYHFKPQTILDQFKKKFPLSDLKFKQINTVEFLKTDHNQLPNNLYYDLALKYYLPAQQIPPRDEGFSIVRKFYRPDDKKNENPITQAKVGEVLRGHIQITVPETRKFAIVEDYIPAGMELVNLDLATKQKSLRLRETELKGRELNPDFKEMHHDRLLLFEKNLGPGVYEFEYYVRALVPGEFTHLPARASEMYFPENFGRTPGEIFKIKR